MLSFIKRHIFIIIVFIFTLIVSFITFLTFIGKNFILVNDTNLDYLLFTNISLLLFFFIIIFKEILNSIKSNINVRGSIANRKYIIFFFSFYAYTITINFNLFIIYFFICLRKIFR